MRLIGTAGHIDHGKSTLVQALTGIHPSHLPEEHAREMTIDLGYAHLVHPGGERLGLVDVPGHERLVRNMVAGATGFELALWVVDAREGLMPQSLEHLQILELLAVRALIPVVTKADLATDEQIAATRAAIGALLQSVRLAVQPVQVVDSVSGRGIPELREAVFALCGSHDAPDAEALAYLPIDRVFTRRGIGTVITGTLMRGRLAEGEAVELSSQPGSWRVRSLNNHHAAVPEIGAGHRVGINLAALPADGARRGDVLVAPGYPFRSRFLNVRLHWVAGVEREWKHGVRLLFHAGSTETLCRLWGVAREGESAWAQIELPAEMLFFPGQRFILRDTNPLATVGGGEVLDLAPDRPRRVTPAELAAYRSRERGEPWLAGYLATAAAPVLELGALARRWMVPERELRRQAERDPALRCGSAPGSQNGALLVWLADTGLDLLQRLRDFAGRQTRGEQMVPYARLGRELDVRSPLLQPLLHCLLELDDPAAASLRADTRLDRSGLVLFPGRIGFTPDEQRIADRIVAQLAAEGLRPTRVRELRRVHAERPERVDRVLAKLCGAGRLVSVSPDFVLHPTAADELRHAPARQRLSGIRAAEFGQALGLSRKYSIPFLEFLNAEGVLRREGDLHFLNG